MAIDLSGRHVVVTCGAGALGGAVVDALAAAGAICHAPGRAELDLTDEAAVSRFYAALPELWASVQVAGGFAAAPIVQTSLAALRAQLDINLITCFLACREAVKRMVSRPGGGRIVNLGSRAALVPGGGAIAYSVAKAGVVALTQALADEVKASQILVNAVIPSIIDTPANRAAMPGAPHDRWPQPAALASAVVWLASPQNELVSGALLPIYGEA
jgi:NAD(P)-dependent dehydrogenase (short-subunit alcohol dehydrogenase family)